MKLALGSAYPRIQQGFREHLLFPEYWAGGAPEGRQGARKENRLLTKNLQFS